MKKKILSIIALCLCVCFMFAGCNLVSQNNSANLKSTAIDVNGVAITRQDILNAYDTYFDSYYNSYKEEAFDKLIADLITEKLILNEANKLVESGEIKLTNTEKNYLYAQTFDAVLSNLEGFEEQAREILGLPEVEEDEEDADAKKYIYTEYVPYASVVKNETTGKYEIKLEAKNLIAKVVDGETEYEYVTNEEYKTYTEPTTLLSYSDFVYEKLTSADATEKAVAKEAKRIYVSKLLKNEEGAGLSTNADEVFVRELERVYNIVYKNFISTKLYQYKTKDINVSESDVLNSYINKVLENKERYEEDDEAFAKEVMASVISTNMYGSYSSGGFNISNVFYTPESEEKFFMVYHIIVQYTDEQVEIINEAKTNLTNGTISQEDYDAIVEAEKAKIRLNERNADGEIVVKSTDDNAITFDKMLEELNKELAEATTAHEKGDIFNKYLYKYTSDTGSLQVQMDYFGGEHTNWYGYVVGTEEDGSFLEEFVDQARKLYDEGKGQLGAISDKFYMESWTEETLKDEDGNAIKDKDNKEVKVKKLSYGGFDVMMYAGTISNPFASLDAKDFTVKGLGENALYVLSQKRLGLTTNKTLFDLIFEELYTGNYNNIVEDVKETLNETANVKKYENVYKDINPLA